jgi:hypothetical protein
LLTDAKSNKQNWQVSEDSHWFPWFALAARLLCFYFRHTTRSFAPDKARCPFPADYRLISGEGYVCCPAGPEKSYFLGTDNLTAPE